MLQDDASVSSFVSNDQSTTNFNNQQSTTNFNKQKQSSTNFNKQQPQSSTNFNKQQPQSSTNFNKQQQPSATNFSKQQQPSATNFNKQQPSATNFNRQQQQQSPSTSNFNKQQQPSATNFNKQQQPSATNFNKQQQPSATNFNNSQKMASNTNFNQNKFPQKNMNQEEEQEQDDEPDGGGNMQPSQMQSKWKKVIDPNSGKPYYYHEDTKETTWTLPPELAQSNNPQSGVAKRLSAQMLVQQGGSQLNFQTAWDESEEEEEPKDEESWDKDDNKEDDDHEDSNDGLDVYDPNKQTSAVVNSNVVDEPSLSEEDDEKPANPLGDDEEVIVADTSNKFWVIGESQADKYPMTTYGEKYFQKDKHKSMFKSPTVQELLKFAQYKKVKAAIRKLDSKLNQQALQTWKNINSYMGTRKSGKNSTGHVEKLIHFALKGAEELRDEIFIQLCKQTNGNPRADSLIKGWKLMAICCSTFPPSDEFACYLAVYLFAKSKEPGSVGQYAKFSLEALDRTMEVGQRRLQPTNIEIAKIEERQPIPIKIKFLDGSFRTLLVSSQTRASQVEKALADALRITSPESFGLFEMEEPAPGWEKGVYQKRDQMERQAKIDDLQNLPMDRELEQNERIMDVKSSWERSKKKQQKKIFFIYKCKIFSKAQESSYSKNSWKIAFLTSVWHIIHGYYPVEEKEAFQLAALQLQATHGLQPQGFYKPDIIIDQIDKFLPYQYVSKYKSEGAEKILERHGEFEHLDKQDAYRKYIDYLRKSSANPYFGCCFFPCVRVSRLKKAQNEEQEDLLIGVCETGVIFVHPITKEILERYKMEEILTYGFRNNAFLFVAGTLMTQKKYQFATMLGKQMNDLLRAQIDLRVQQAEVQGYNIMA